ncbi:putative HMP/thiamine import ATP-binding protein YkoD [anaerobic digester metagenome]
MIGLEDYSYTYPGRSEPALNGVTLHIRRGEVLLVTGPTGAGKTTLCLAASGILRHEFGGTSTGRAILMGRPVEEYADLSGIGRHVGVVFDDPEAQLIFTTVEEEIASGLEGIDLPREELIARMEHVLELTATADLRERAPHTLSGGQKQRVAIAATLALGTEILVLDEPTSELDEEGTQMLFRIIERLRAEGKTVLLVEHKLDALFTLADRMVFLEGGRILAEGTPDELLLDERVRSVLHTTPNTPSFCRAQPDHGSGRGSSPNPLISIDGLIHDYGGVTALNGLNLEIDAGTLVAIIGDNGSGKTTLIKHLVGLLKPTHGRVVVGGHDTSAETITGMARHVGLVFQNPDTMLFEETVEREVAFGPTNLGMDDVQGRVDRALSEVGLLSHRNDYPRSLSRGERQRLAVACILAMAPEVIVLDEPTTGLDAAESARVMALASRLRDEGRTIVMVTHNMRIVEDYADRIVLLEHGILVADSQNGGEEVICQRLCNTYRDQVSSTA